MYLNLINNFANNNNLKYNCYQEICLIYLKSEEKKRKKDKENHIQFLKYFREIINISFSFDTFQIESKINNIIQLVFNVINQKSEESSIYQWVEDLIKFLKSFDKGLGIIDKSIGDCIQEMKKQCSRKNIIDFYSELIEYFKIKSIIDFSLYNYLINECGCDEMYFDRKGDKYFCYAPENSERGGKKYEVPANCIALGLEVTERYGDDDNWLANDGRKEEWAVGYYGFGLGMNEIQIKDISYFLWEK